MNLPRVSIIAIFLVALILANGQDTPKAILVDEFGSIACADMLGRQDAFFAELSSNPMDTGYAIIYSNEEKSEALVRRLRANLFMRQFDRTRVQIVLAKSKDGSPVSGSFWRVPPGAEPPPFESIELKTPDATKPFIFGVSFSESDCPSFSPDLFAQLVLDHPGARARLVVYGPTSAWRQSTADEEYQQLMQYTKLPKDRVEFYFVHRPGEPLSWTEYWYLPPRKK